MRHITLAIVAAAAIPVASVASDAAKHDCEQKAIDDFERTHICHVHRIRLRDMFLPVATAPETPPDDPFYRAQVCHFPHAWFFAPPRGAYPFEKPLPKYRHGLVCSGCRRAQLEWAAAHPNTKWGRFILSHQTSNKSLEPTTGRRNSSIFMTKAPQQQATLALTSGGSAPSR